MIEIQIEPTSDIALIDGVACRRWKGTTKNGVPCEVFVHRIAVHNDQDSSELDDELREMPPPSPAIDLRFLLGR